MKKLKYLTEEQALRKAFRIAKIRAIFKYPYDEWIAIAKNWDLNMWTEYDDYIEKDIEYFATIYPVIDNQVDCSYFTRVWSKKAV
jgi:hypothetical protein